MHTTRRKLSKRLRICAGRGWKITAGEVLGKKSEKRQRLINHHVREGKEMISARTSYPATESAYRWRSNTGFDCLFMS